MTDCEARRQNGWPTPPAASTASQTMPAAGTPCAMKPPELWLLMQFGLGAVPCVSRRPMIDVTGPQAPTVPTFHNTSSSAHGVYHEPTNKLPQGPWMPTPALRDASVAAMPFDCSIGAFCEISNQAVSPPPRCSRPRTPQIDPPCATSHFDTLGAPFVAEEYLNLPK